MLLIAKMVEVCEAKGISHLIYGMYNYGNKRNSSLLQVQDSQRIRGIS